MRRPSSDHTSLPFRVHALAEDFELLDVWRFPVTIAASVSFAEFSSHLRESQRELATGNGPAGLLFRLRGWLGRVLGWDRGEARSIPGSADRSVRARLEGAAATAAASDAPDSPTEAFAPVYQDENESLLEIGNATVHALLHLGRVPLESGRWAPQMAVYAKTRGRLGKGYMALISPFRHGIVYPAMMKAVERSWTAHVRTAGLDP